MADQPQVQTGQDPSSTEWTAGQVMQSLNDKIAEVRRAVDVALEGEPPHVPLQYHLEAMGKKDEVIERERIGRVADQVASEARVTELRAKLAEQATEKAQAAQEKQFDEFSKSVNTQITRLVEAVGKLNVGAA